MRLSTALAALAVPFAALPVQAAHPADVAQPPLRIVRQGLPDVAGLRRFIEVSHEGCLAAKGLPPRPAPVVADSQLSRLVVREEEELFDGVLWARYEVQRSIAADPASQCRLMVFQARSVDIERTCESSIRGTGPLLSELLDPLAGPLAPPQLDEQRGGSPECDRPREAINLNGLPLQDAGLGAQCVWNSDLVAKVAGLKPASQRSDPGSFDICLYARRPFHYVKGFGRAVELKSRSEDRSLSGAYLPAFAGQIAGLGNLKLTTFAEGQPIPAERFSRSAADAFLRLPVKSPLAP